MGLGGSGPVPSLLPALDNPEWSLTLVNASSSTLTLKAVLVVADVGMLLAIAYAA